MSFQFLRACVAPHMAADHRFYKRFNFESIPLEVYEVRDVGHRQESPGLERTARPVSRLAIAAVSLDTIARQ